mmetsp:Transcript_130068/g.404608  ORF Transcript_130068/g.404608 Transcript_130068/m.404608 type:complete len:297 (+) Transcript_130068:708-1598(+)
MASALSSECFSPRAAMTWLHKAFAASMRSRTSEYLTTRWQASWYNLSKTPFSLCCERACANSLRPTFSMVTATGLPGPSCTAESPIASMRFRSSSTKSRSLAISSCCRLQSSRRRIVSSVSPGSGAGTGAGVSGLGEGDCGGSNSLGFGVSGAGGGVAGAGPSSSCTTTGSGSGCFLPKRPRTSFTHVSNGDTALTCASSSASGAPSLPMSASTPIWPLEPLFRIEADTTPRTLRRRSCVRRSALCDSATMGSCFFALGDGDDFDGTLAATSFTTSFSCSTITSFSMICGGLFASR